MTTSFNLSPCSFSITSSTKDSGSSMEVTPKLVLKEDSGMNVKVFSVMQPMALLESKEDKTQLGGVPDKVLDAKFHCALNSLDVPYCT